MIRGMNSFGHTHKPTFRHLLSGIDTLEVCFYLRPLPHCALKFDELLGRKEALRQARFREPDEIKIGAESFLLQAYGSGSGYPLIFSNSWAVVSYGERNSPPFYVKFLSTSLWQFGWQKLVGKFLQWATDVGFEIYAPEKVSRVDVSFDYWISEIDFDEKSFVSLSSKDSHYRENQQSQTFDFGRGGIKLRVYDKVAEIRQQSGKTFFYDLWGMEEGVWRIEWQIRKELLRRFGTKTLEGLQDQAGDMLTYLSAEHDTLRIPNTDTNRSRWPLHDLWRDVQKQAAKFTMQGVLAEFDTGASIDERLQRCALSLYGYTKAVAAMEAVKTDKPRLDFCDALNRVGALIRSAHNPAIWDYDVAKKISHLRLGS
jgi:hypothetical protein